jgi:hypothetical protein
MGMLKESVRKKFCGSWEEWGIFSPENVKKRQIIDVNVG